MSTTATMSNQDRRFLNHARVGPSVKRKEEREDFDDPKPMKLTRLGIPRPGSPAPAHSEPDSKNQLLAGYLAHEFLTKGTLFGQPWDPARAEAVPVSRLEPRRLRSKAEKTSSRAEPQEERNQRYVEVADLLKTDGAHLPGIVNPTQLARSLQL